MIATKIDKSTKKYKSARRRCGAKWIRNESDVKAVAEGYYFDEAKADRVVDFFSSCLKHTTGSIAGQPFELLDWQRDDFIKPLFGWMHPNGYRRFNKAYVSMGKKNGKSTLMAGLSLYMLAADGENNAQCFCVAGATHQAALIFDEAVLMVEKSPTLDGVTKINRTTKTMTYYDDGMTNGAFHVLSSDGGTAEGPIISWLAFDELHTQTTRVLWDALVYGTSSREQPLHVSTTTAGFDKSSICYEQYQYAKRVLDGSLYDPNYFALIYEAEPDDDWTDPAVWRKANPSLGHFLPEPMFKRHLEEAKLNPAVELSFRRYRLNQWTEKATKWLDLKEWDACTADFDVADLRARGAVCYAGLDVAATSDLTAFAMVYELDGKYYLPDPLFWCSEHSAKKRSTYYQKFILDGHIKATEGNVTDYDVVIADILKLPPAGHVIKGIGADFLFQGAQLCNNLSRYGPKDWITAVVQTTRHLCAPTVELGKMVLSKSLHHTGNPVMRWMVANTMLEQDHGGNVKPSREKSSEKIDGVIATVCALYLHNKNATTPTGCIYDKYDMITA